MKKAYGYVVAGLVASVLALGCAGSDDTEEENVGETKEAYVGCGGECWWASPGTQRCGYTCGGDHRWHPNDGACHGGCGGGGGGGGG